MLASGISPALSDSETHSDIFINPFQDEVCPGVSNSGMTFSKIENYDS